MQIITYDVVADSGYTFFLTFVVDTFRFTGPDHTLSCHESDLQAPTTLCPAIKVDGSNHFTGEPVWPSGKALGW